MIVDEMNQEVATKVIELMLDVGARLDNSVALVQDNCSEAEFCAYRQAVGKLMGTMLLDIMNPVFDKYPELKPEQLK